MIKYFILHPDTGLTSSEKNMNPNFLLYNLWHPICCTLMGLLSSLSQVVCPSASGVARDGPGRGQAWPNFFLALPTLIW